MKELSSRLRDDKGRWRDQGLADQTNIS